MEMKSVYQPSRLPSALYAVGMVVLYLGQRVFDVGRPSNITTLVGVAALIAAVAVRVRRLQRLPPGFRGPERTLLGIYGLGFAAVALYFLSSDLLFHLAGRTLTQMSPKLAAALSALWPALWVAAALPVLFVELSLWSMARAPVLDSGRLRSALFAGFGIAFALVFSFGAAYVAAERDVKADLSHFRTTRPGDSTKKIVQVLDKEVLVHIFFPPANEVREEVESYFSDLARGSKFLVVNYWDHALHPAKARELDVQSNGVIVIQRDSLKEKITLPLNLEGARTQLRTLDQDVNKRLLGVTRKQKIAYFTIGHDERGEKPVDDNDKRATIKRLRQMLTDMSFEARDLGVSSGLGTDVPADAGVLLIVGPRRPFLPEENAALIRYMDKNGRFFIALDPDGGQEMKELLAPLGLTYHATNLANDKVYLPRNYQKSDREILTTAAYSSHVSVSTISRFGARAPVVLLGAGYIEKDEKSAVGIVNVDFTVHADPNTFPDKNGDFEPSEGETRNAYELAAAVNKRNASALLPEEEARAVVLADSDMVSDLILGNNGAGAFAFDGLRWLGGEERIAGAVNTEEDVPLNHTRKQDMALFYTSVFAAPAAVLGLGFLMSRKRRRARKAAKARAAAPQKAPEQAPPPPGSGTPPPPEGSGGPPSEGSTTAGGPEASP